MKTTFICFTGTYVLYFPIEKAAFMLISSFLDEKMQHGIAAFTLEAIGLSQERYPQSMGNGAGSPLNNAIA